MLVPYFLRQMWSPKKKETGDTAWAKLRTCLFRNSGNMVAVSGELVLGKRQQLEPMESSLPSSLQQLIVLSSTMLHRLLEKDQEVSLPESKEPAPKPR